MSKASAPTANFMKLVLLPPKQAKLLVPRTPEWKKLSRRDISGQELHNPELPSTTVFGTQWLESGPPSFPGKELGA